MVADSFRLTQFVRMRFFPCFFNVIKLISFNNNTLSHISNGLKLSGGGGAVGEEYRVRGGSETVLYEFVFFPAT